MNLCDEKTIRELLGRHGFHFSKSMGQNFLIDPEVPARIAEASQADRSCGVLEIGPGIGPLTAELAQRAGKVVSVELDKTLLPVLAETMARIQRGNRPRRCNEAGSGRLIAEKFQGLTPIVCANLPYNITTPVLTRIIETPCLKTVTVLIQKEVAQRLAAPQGSADGGSFFPLSAILYGIGAAVRCSPGKVPPAPKVTSAVLRCVRRDHPAVEVADEAFFFRVMRGAFLLRRKTLANSLCAALPGFSKEQILDAMSRCGLPADIRGERLTLQDFLIWLQF